MSVLMRSLMFVPGHRQRMIDRALGLGEFRPGALDVAMLDLEDGVPPAEKEGARAAVAAALGRPSNGVGPRRWVRMNAIGSDRRDADLRAVVRPGLEGLVAPKVDVPEDVAVLAGILDELEPAARLAPGAVRIIASIESGLGLINAYRIASASPRVAGLMFGGEDYALDLGLPALREGEAAELLFARASIVNACAAARKLSFDGVWPDLDDPVGLRANALQARRLGFSGKTMIHPAQTEIINELFSPSAADVDYAARVMRAFDEAQARGDGAVALGGRLLDLPIVERARRTLDMAKLLGG